MHIGENPGSLLAVETEFPITLIFAGVSLGAFLLILLRQRDMMEPHMLAGGAMLAPEKGVYRGAD